MPNDVKSNTIDKNVPEICPSDVLLSRWYEGYASKDESLFVQKHLSTCKNCFDLIATLIEISHYDLTETEDQEIENMVKMSPKDQASKIVAYYKKYNHPVSYFFEKIKDILIDKFIKLNKDLREYFIRLIEGVKIRQIIYVTTVVIICAFGGLRLLHFFNTTYLITATKKSLLKNYAIHINDVQLTGNYRSSGTGEIMSDQNKANQIDLNKAKERVYRALEHGADSSKALPVLGQIFILQKDYLKAGQTLHELDKKSNNAVGVKNDLGVLYFRQRDWTNAASEFEQAIRIDPNFYHAYWNLALVDEKLGKYDEAMSCFNKYIALENDENWRNAARRKLIEIEKK